MFFSIAKIFWVFAKPLNLILILLSLAALLLWSRWRRVGIWLTSLLAASLLAVATLPIGEWLLAPLQRQFAPINMTDGHVTGIVLLSGGVVDLRISRKVGHAVPGRAVDRLVEFIRLARAYPRARLLICGGSGKADGVRDVRWDREAPLIAEYLVRHGIARERLLVEAQSRDTFENAVLGQALAKPKAADRWLLVTSAWHMPRAMVVFHALDWPVVAAPPMRPMDGKNAYPLRFNLNRGLHDVGRAMHEYLGLLSYWLNGRIKTLWPAP
jgi:uncharacterized SAM-binding protein YcdF (DUF218 family)